MGHRSSGCRLTSRYSHGLQLSLHLGVGDLAVVDDNGPAAVAVTWRRPANLLGELGFEVGHEAYESVVIITSGDIDLLPAGHDKGVIRSDDDEVVNALLLCRKGR